MKTAIQWLKQQYIERSKTLPSSVFQDALDMEKEQLNIARVDGLNLANKGYSKKNNNMDKITEQLIRIEAKLEMLLLMAKAKNARKENQQNDELKELISQEEYNRRRDKMAAINELINNK